MQVGTSVAASISISADPGNVICAGTSVTYTAIGDNGGSTPVYQWKINSVNIGTNSNTFSTSVLFNNDVVTCEMISNANCVTGSPAISNSIQMTVNGSIINSFTPAYAFAGASVVISGSGFTGATAVDFNGLAASFVIDNDNQITATVPLGVTTGPINVTTLCGTISSSSDFIPDNSIVLLNVKVLIEGFSIGNGQMRGVLSPTVCDTIQVSLADANYPYTVLETVKHTINTSGEGAFEFPGTVIGGSYYIIVKHRNTLETWSDVPVTLSSPVNSYDFTIAMTKAFGNNEVDLGGSYAIRSGDVNQDGVINSDDEDSVESNALLFLSGYVPQDLTGDYLVESSDLSLIENNLSRTLARP